jgi:methionine-S-sulfoxide reductase
MALNPLSHNALASDTPAEKNAGLKTVLFGGGCFWGLELRFQRLDGVKKTKVGYAQGDTVNPSYKEVKTGTTGHVEVVQVRRNL